MALLKGKISGSTLLETIVATVLILVIFAVSSLVINSVFKGALKGDTSEVRNRINLLEYQIINDRLELPHSEDFRSWEIELTVDRENSSLFDVRATKKGTQREITLKRPYGY